jgi:small-conductance mechanosensitive channel
VPQKQWDVGRELRKRVRRDFDKHGIEIPYPERIVTVRGGGPDHELPPESVA